MIINRYKKNQSTLCNYTTTKQEIIEGHILGYGDNYPCIVLYNIYEAKFEAIEFGYDNDVYRSHEILSYTSPYIILGHIENKVDWIEYIAKLKPPKNFDYSNHINIHYNFNK